MSPKFLCPGGNEAESFEGPCEEVDCVDCCVHSDLDRGTCPDCGYEEDAGARIDYAMSIWEDR